LTERHLIEISEIFTGEYLSPWFTTETAQLEICQEAGKRNLTTRETKTLVTKTRSMIEGPPTAPNIAPGVGGCGRLGGFLALVNPGLPVGSLPSITLFV
jgi:hypothetical protein